MTKSPLSGTKKRAAPYGQRETRRKAQPADGRHRASSVAGRCSCKHARHKLVADTPDAFQTGRPGQKLRLCLDKGYDAGWLKTYLHSHCYEPHIQSRKEESDASKDTNFKAHRRVVERTHSWMNRFRRVLTRWEKKTENYEAMLHFACGLIVWNKVLFR